MTGRARPVRHTMCTTGRGRGREMSRTRRLWRVMMIEKLHDPGDGDRDGDRTSVEIEKVDMTDISAVPRW